MAQCACLIVEPRNARHVRRTAAEMQSVKSRQWIYHDRVSAHGKRWVFWQTHAAAAAAQRFGAESI